MQRTLALGLAIGTGLLAHGKTPSAEPSQEVASAVIAAERAALDRWGKGDPGGFLSLYADEVTYFDPFQESRLDGRERLRATIQPFAGKIAVYRYEMLNPKVQGRGDIVVLSYNLQNYAKQPDGRERPATRWNSTTVFRRIDGRWRTIHSHWSFTKPQLQTPPSP